MDNQDNLKQQDKTQSRRKFLFTAAKVVPVVTTIASKPVWASNVSISGNLSGNTSGYYEVAKFNGCSPGYYKAKRGDIYHSNNRLPASEYTKTFGELFGYNGLSTATGKRVKYLLKDSHSFELERRLVAHYYNAYDSGYSGNPSNFPYKQDDIKAFYLEIGVSISTSDANTILINLEHFGMADANLPGQC